MGNVIQFTPRAKPQPTEEAVEVQEQVAVTINSAPREMAVPSIGNTASAQVVSTLLFYANQGWDGGKKARQALVAMQTVLAAQ